MQRLSRPLPSLRVSPLTVRRSWPTASMISAGSSSEGFALSASSLTVKFIARACERTDGQFGRPRWHSCKRENDDRSDRQQDQIFLIFSVCSVTPTHRAGPVFNLERQAAFNRNALTRSSRSVPSASCRDRANAITV